MTPAPQVWGIATTPTRGTQVPTDPLDWDINPEALLRVRTNIAAVAARTDPDLDPDDGSAGHQDSGDDMEGEDLEDELDEWTDTPVDVGSG